MTEMRRIWVGRAGWAAALSVALAVGCQRDGGAAKARRDSSLTAAPTTASEAAHSPATSDAATDQGASDAEHPEPSLSDIVQLTSGFPRAGEAYFSRDAKWIIFQASPQGEQQYQMYVA